MFLALPFPHLDPVIFAIGPFAIRWYALAYIAGIALGWVYARAILRNQRLWGGPAPISVVQFDDYVLWVTLGIIMLSASQPPASAAMSCDVSGCGSPAPITPTGR